MNLKKIVSLVFPVVIVIIIISIYFFLFRIYHFKGETMENTISDGQYLVINKILTPQQDDIILYFGNDFKNQVKRIVAEPGDTIFIKNGDLYVNSKKIIYRNQINKYRINSYNDSVTKVILKEFLSKEQRNFNQNNFLLLLPPIQSKKISKYKDVTLNKFVIDSSFIDDKIICLEEISGRNSDFFGPIIVPSKGMKINLNLKKYINFEKFLLLTENKKELVQFKNSLKNNTEYTIKENYFFVLNDNRSNSNDSRKFGFIPQKNIIGVAIRKF